MGRWKKTGNEEGLSFQAGSYTKAPIALNN